MWRVPNCSEGDRSMPRYYFHLRHPQKRVVDCEGVMLADAEAARAQAVRTVRDFYEPALDAVGPAWTECILEVRDARGCRVIDIAFSQAAKLAIGSSQDEVQVRAPTVVH